MDIFREVRERADILKVCEVLGLKLERAYKCKCPFHKEKTASFSISPTKNIFCCFGCYKKGDAITLVQELLKISPLEACKFLNDRLYLGLDFKGSTPKYEINRYEQAQKAKQRFMEWENRTFQLLCDYLHSLNPIELMQEENIIDYYIELFIYGTDEEKLCFKKTEERYINKIKRTLKT